MMSGKGKDLTFIAAITSTALLQVSVLTVTSLTHCSNKFLQTFSAQYITTGALVATFITINPFK